MIYKHRVSTTINQDHGYNDLAESSRWNLREVCLPLVPRAKSHRCAGVARPGFSDFVLSLVFVPSSIYVSVQRSTALSAYHRYLQLVVVSCFSNAFPFKTLPQETSCLLVLYLLWSTQLNTVLFRGLKLVFTLALLGHLFGCFWSFVSLSEGTPEDDDSAPSVWWQSLGLAAEDLTGRYIASIYWAFTTMTTVGWVLSRLERELPCFFVCLQPRLYHFVKTGRHKRVQQASNSSANHHTMIVTLFHLQHNILVERFCLQSPNAHPPPLPRPLSIEDYNTTILGVGI